MIYHLSLQTAGWICGIVLLAIGGMAFVRPNAAREFAARLPRSQPIGIALLTIDLIWCIWLLATMEMGEFSMFRRPLLILLPITYILVLRFVNEFLAVRALGILCLLAAEPLLDAAFFRYEVSRLFVTSFAYVLVVVGLFWVASPYLLRDQISWTSRSDTRWRSFSGALLVYGAAVIVCAIVFY
ncbi:MAG: hypothetical protein ACJ8I9_07110 [Chthoniobacterales bacterium]